MARNSGQPRRNNHPNSVKLLQRLENGLDAFMDASVDAFLLFDDNLDLMSINPAGERLFGVSKEMVVGKNIVELEPDIKETGKYDKYLDVMKTGELFFVEEPFSHPKFGDMHLSIKAFKMREGLGMIVNDITERRQMEEALRESELLAIATIEGMSDGVVLVGMDGKVAYINKAFEKMLGYKLEELVGTSAVELPTYHGSKDRKKARQALKMVIEKGSAEPIDMVALTKDGVEIPINFTASVVRDAEGNPKTLVAVIRDVTERKKAEDALRRSEEHFRALVENSHEAVVVLKGDGTISFGTTTIERMLGYTSEDLLGTGGFGFAHPDDMPKVMESFTHLMENPSSVVHIELRIQHKDGSWRIVEAVARNLLENKAVEGIVINWRDITERKKVEEALRQSEERFRRVLDNAVDMIYWVNLKAGTYDYVSPSSEKVIGYTPDEFIALRMAGGISLAHPDDLERLNQNVIDLLMNAGNGSASSAIEYRFAHKKLGYRWMFDNRSIVYDGDEPVGIVGSLRDITEHKKAEEALRESEAKLKLYLDNSPDGIYISDVGGHFLYGNREAEKTVGYSKEELIGKSFLEIGLLPPEYSLKAAQLLELNSAGKSTGPDEFELIRKNGSRVFVEISTYPVGEGDNLEVIGIARDTTERKKMEETLQRLSDAVKMTSESIAIADLKGRIVDINEAGLRMYGLDDRADLVGKNPFDIIVPEDRPRALENMSKIVETGSVKDIEYHIMRKDGKRALIETSVSVIKGIGGKPKGLVAVTRDITEHRMMEEELAKSEKRYRQLIENMQEGLWLIDKDFITTFVNPRMAEILGYTAEEMLGKLMFEFTDERGIEVAKYNIERKQATQEQHDFEFIRKDGARVYASLETSSVTDEAGNYVGALACVADITERKQAEEALRVSEERYRLVVENASEAILVAQDGMARFFNTRVIELFGYSREELISKPFIEFIHPEDQAMVAGRYMARLEGKEVPSAYSFRVVDKTGNVRWVEISAVTINWEGRPASLNFLTDITERKKAEEALRESEGQLRRLVDQAPDIVFRWSAEKGLEYCSPIVLEITGYTIEELLADPMVGLELAKGVDSQLAEDYEKTVKGGASLRYREVSFARKDGRQICLEMRSHAVRDKEGKVVAYEGILRDITQRKMVEEEKRRMEEQLRLAGRLAAVGELAAGVAHELNNPLAAIQGYSQFLSSSSNLDVDTRKDVEIIYREALRAGKITQNLLSFARRHEPEKRYISINETVEKTLELQEHQMKVNNIELVTELAPDLPKTMADFYQLQQVFVNIINNAEQAMVAAHGKGKLVIKTQWSDGMIQVIFADDGPGISEENLKRIFDPFFTTKEVGKGTGLGLSICYGIAEAHGGRIYARSKLGTGATFIVEIPILIGAESK